MKAQNLKRRRNMKLSVFQKKVCEKLHASVTDKRGHHLFQDFNARNNFD